MKVSIIKIGKSKGISIPNQILKQYDITDKVELILEKDHIVLRPIEDLRKGWNKAFKKMHEEDADELLIADVFEDETCDVWNN